MAHAQSSPRGLFAKQRIDVGAQQLTDGTTYLDLNNGIQVSGLAGGLLTADANVLILPSGIKLTAKTAAPATRYGPGSTVFVSNSTGIQLAVNTTGTTWAYTQLTSVLA